MTDVIDHPATATSTAIQRFMAFGWDVTESGCWEWRGSRARRRGGYGQLNDRGKMLKTHRLAYEHFKGKIPDGMVVRHTCDNPPCCNPDHLLVGTLRDNSQDSVRRGRASHQVMTGEHCPAALLTWDQVTEIRASHEAGVALAEKYGVTPSTISSIRVGKSWKEPGSVRTESI